MPDWFYLAFLKPWLLCLAPETARTVVLNLWTRRPPFFFSRPAVTHPITRQGITFPSPIGLGARLDPTGRILPVLRPTEVGFVEVGPVFLDPIPPTRPLDWWPVQKGWWSPDPPESPGIAFWETRLAALRQSPVPLLVRVSVTPGTTQTDATRQVSEIVTRLGRSCNVILLDTLQRALHAGWTGPPWGEHLKAVSGAIRAAGSQSALWTCLPLGLPDETLDQWLAACRQELVTGVLIDGSLGSDGGLLYGTPGREPTLELVRLVRRRAPQMTVAAGGGLSTRDDARRFREAGADLVCVDTGLVMSGPQLIRKLVAAWKDS